MFKEKLTVVLLQLSYKNRIMTWLLAGTLRGRGKRLCEIWVDWSAANPINDYSSLSRECLTQNVIKVIARTEHAFLMLLVNRGGTFYPRTLGMPAFGTAQSILISPCMAEYIAELLSKKESLPRESGSSSSDQYSDELNEAQLHGFINVLADGAHTLAAEAPAAGSAPAPPLNETPGSIPLPAPSVDADVMPVADSFVAVAGSYQFSDA